MLCNQFINSSKILPKDQLETPFRLPQKEMTGPDMHWQWHSTG